MSGRYWPALLATKTKPQEYRATARDDSGRAVASKWTVLDGPHLEQNRSWNTPYVYVRIASPGRTERLHLTNTQADQISALQAR